MGLRIGGYKREVAFDKLGTTMVIAAALLMAIRTVKWTTKPNALMHERQWEEEIDRSLSIVNMIISAAAVRWPQKFPMKDVAWYLPDEEDVPK